MNKHVNITVTGRVQGVGFRYSTFSIARVLGIKGFVRNLPNKYVYIEAEGPENLITDFINWCRKGPEYARVDEIVYHEAELKDFADFQIA